ncbi:TadE/TadG family type IV pilus assembly protein [Geoanaerobacter pelophilus]|nr:TadE/TadG family type IV pilus assembly protein [Geoanaerobacter pelophilus]
MDRKGQTTVEFALTAVLLLFLLFVLVDFSVMLYVNLTMQHAVRQATRSAVVRKGEGDPRGELIREIRDNSNGLYDKNALPEKEPMVTVITPSAADPPAGAVVADTGEAGELIAVSLKYSWPLLTPLFRSFFSGGAYDFTVRVTMKNEP